MIERRFTLDNREDVIGISSYLMLGKLTQEPEYSKDSINYKIGSGKVSVIFEKKYTKVFISKEVPRKISDKIAVMGGYRWRPL